MKWAMSSTSTAPSSWARRCLRILACPHAKRRKAAIPPTPKRWRACGTIHPVIDHILLYRTYQKLNSTYVEGLLKVVGADGRIHSTFNQTETRTGRISSSEPNLQNIPVRTELGSRFRKYFIAPQGDVLLDADYSQIELRLLAAHLRRRSACARRSVPAQTSTAALRPESTVVPPEQVTPAAALVRQGGQLRHRVRHRRVQPVQGYRRQRQGGRRVHQKLFRQLSRASKAIWTRPWSRARENGYVTTLYGRRRTLPELASSQFQRAQPGRAHGHEHPHPGHRRGHHQAGHGARIPPPDGRGPARHA